MITQIEIDGFKTFQDFKLELGPFQVIVGVNGTGKSNLFDALRLLSRLADADLRTAFQDLRGEAGELFRLLPDGQPTNKIKMAVELFIDRHIRDSWGAEAELKFTRLRYEVHIERRADERGLERLYVEHESLTPLARGSDAWLKRHLAREANRWLPRLTGGRSPFISTSPKDDRPTIALHQDGRSGKQASVAERVERTILSGVTNTEFPHAFGVREEMRAWRFLQLNPEVLRQPGEMLAPTVVAPDGSNLPSALARMQSEDALLLNDVSRDLANLVPGITGVEIEEDTARERYLIRARTEDGNTFSSRVLSDGTLRMLALVTLKNDPQHKGVLCFEEPENGVHPFRLGQMAQLLRDLATDFSDSEQQGLPLRQLLVNTHSPVFAGQTAVSHCLLFAQMVQRVQPGQVARITQITPVDPRLHKSSGQLKLDWNDTEGQYTLNQVIKYLESGNVHEAIAALKEPQR
jgi:predicted ATPase